MNFYVCLKFYQIIFVCVDIFYESINIIYGKVVNLAKELKLDTYGQK